jgi:hypothetical protein
MLKLQWSQIGPGRCIAWIHPDQAKAGRAIPVPLNESAVCVLRKQRRKHDRWVLLSKGSASGR